MQQSKNEDNKQSIRRERVVVRKTSSREKECHKKMSGSKKSSYGKARGMKARGKARTDDGHAADDSIAANLPRTALSTDDPIALTTILEASKTKNFLYKVEPNMARINAASVDLISTTATLLLKSLVDKAVQEEQNDLNNKIVAHGEDADASTKHVLLTSNRIKNTVLDNKPSGLGFLEETYENFRDKDASFLPSKLCEYVPRTAKRKPGALKQSAVHAKRNVLVGQNASEHTGNIDDQHNRSNKRLKQTIDLKGSSSLLLSSECANDATPIERAIAEAANAAETIGMDKIIEDDDDYD